MGAHNSHVTLIRAQTEDGQIKTFKGREAWALNELIRAGANGCTPINNPAPRWSHYVFLLRRSGLNVETVDERHGGAFAGTHARYVLRTKLEVLAVEHGKQNRRAA